MLLVKPCHTSSEKRGQWIPTPTWDSVCRYVTKSADDCQGTAVHPTRVCGRGIYNQQNFYRLSVGLGQHRGVEGLGHSARISSATAWPFVGCPWLAVLPSSGGVM